MSRRFTLGLVVGALLVALSMPAVASAAKGPKLGVYDCQGVSSGLLHSIKLAKNGKYVWGQYRNGKKILDPVRGKWKMKGKTKVVFKSGVYKEAGYSGVYYPPSKSSSRYGYIALKDKNGASTNIACYPVP